MTSSRVFTLRWGILATGWIASEFSNDILLDPTTRDVHDVRHVITAIASSSSIQKAKQFAQQVGAHDATLYDNYDGLLKDPNVDVVYVATPHSHHYQNVKSALLAKKHVLCEKPFTVNSKQADLLVSLAQKQNVFLLEAVWTRFFPLTLSIRDLIRNGEIGHVHRVTADFSTVVNKQEKGLHHRMFNPELAGGSLLDLGVYSLNWLILAIYDAQNQRKGEPSVIGTLVKVPETGVDEAATVVLGWDDAIGIATSSVSIPTAPDEANPALAGPAVKICGSKATITIPYPGVYQPSEYSIHPHSGGKVVKKTFPIPGKGMFWQADETARCIRDGKKESDILPVSETLLVMRIMDRVREQNGFKYPESIEKV